MKLLDRFLLWRARRRHAAHRRWLRKHKVTIDRAPSPDCVVSNWREKPF